MVLNINHANFFSTLASGYSLDSFNSFLVQRFINAGWGSAIATNNSGATKIAVFQLAFNPLATHGTVRAVLENSISGTTITTRLRLFTQLNYNTETFAGTTNTGANVATGSTFTISNTVALIAYTIPITQEMTGVALVESPSVFKGFLGLAYPTAKETWVNENSFVYAKLVQPTAPNSFWLPCPLSSGVTNTSTAQVARSKIDTFATRNPVNSEVQLIKEPFVTHSTYGIDGRFNGDIAICNNSGLTIGDINVVTPGVEEWWNMFCGDNGIAFRCV